jgi:hypothetical protein
MKKIVKEYFLLKNTFNPQIARNKLFEKIWGRLSKIPLLRDKTANFYFRKHETILQYLENEFEYFLKNYLYDEEIEFDNSNSKIIFSMWIQGEENAPKIIQKTIESQRSYAERYDYQYVLLDEKNLFNYIDLPEIIIEKYKNGIIDFIKFSDIVRVTLLAKYGGVWLDSTIYLETSEKLEYLENDFYTIRLKNDEKIPKFVPKGRWTGFCLAGKQNFILFKFLRDFQIEYFRRFNVAIDYFLIDYLIELAYRKINSVNNSINENSETNPELFFLATNMSKKYNDHDWKEVLKNTSLFKCTYKVKINSNEGTYFNKIIDK